MSPACRSAAWSAQAFAVTHPDRVDQPDPDRDRCRVSAAGILAQPRQHRARLTGGAAVVDDDRAALVHGRLPQPAARTRSTASASAFWPSTRPATRAAARRSPRRTCATARGDRRADAGDGRRRRHGVDAGHGGGDLRAGIPGAELAVLPKVAHLMSVERPDAVAAPYRCGFLDAAGRATRREPARRLSTRGWRSARPCSAPTTSQAALGKAGAFGAPWQDFITRDAWGEIWGDPTLPRKTRSMLTLADDDRAPPRGRIQAASSGRRWSNGVSIEELRALIMQSGDLCRRAGGQRRLPVAQRGAWRGDH